MADTHMERTVERGFEQVISAIYAVRDICMDIRSARPAEPVRPKYLTGARSWRVTKGDPNRSEPPQLQVEGMTVGTLTCSDREMWFILNALAVAEQRRASAGVSYGEVGPE